MDLNILIEKAIVENNTEDITKILSWMLKPSTAFKVIRQTKNYSLIPLFMPFFDHDCVKIMAKICCDVIGTDSVKQIEKYFYDKLYEEEFNTYVTIEAGKRGIPYEDVKSAYIIYTSKYYIGIAKGDHDHLLPDDYGNDQALKLTPFGRYCSKKCMDKLGYTNAKAYLEGALCKNNLETLEFLVIKSVDLNECFNELALDNLYPDDIQFGLKQGLVLTEDTWTKLKTRRRHIYKELQE